MKPLLFVWLTIVLLVFWNILLSAVAPDSWIPPALQLAVAIFAAWISDAEIAVLGAQ